MAWYVIILIVIASIIGLFALIFVLGKALRPKFKYKKPHHNKNIEKPNSKPVISSSVDSIVGLSLDNKLEIDEETISQKPESSGKIDMSGFDKFKNDIKKEQKKTLLEQIRELPPELKVLLFDRGLARKDYEFMSKKD